MTTERMGQGTPVRVSCPDELARLAREGDSAARNALWDEMREVVNRAVDMQWGLPRLWDRDDLGQEAFIVFARVCEAWPGSGFAVYFEKEYPVEFARHVRRAWRKQMRECRLPLSVEVEEDPEATQMYRLAELMEGLSRLPAPMELAVRLHVLWGLPLAQVGRQLGLGRRALGGLLPLARLAAMGAIESEDERLERRVRELYAFADLTGRIHATTRQVRSRLRLAPNEHEELLLLLDERGVLTGRSRGHAGRLPAGGPEVAIRLLRRARDRRTA